MECMLMYMYTYRHVGLYTYVCTYTYRHIYIHIYIYTSVDLCISMHSAVWTRSCSDLAEVLPVMRFVMCFVM